jgi:hypothetical protein
MRPFGHPNPGFHHNVSGSRFSEAKGPPLNELDDGDERVPWLAQNLNSRTFTTRHFEDEIDLTNHAVQCRKKK